MLSTDAQRAQRLCPKGNCSERFPLHGSASLSAVLDLFSQQTTLLRIFLNTPCFPPALTPQSVITQRSPWSGTKQAVLTGSRAADGNWGCDL